MKTATNRFAWAVAAAAAIFAVTLGVRQSMALFIGPMNTATGLGLATISLAFGVGQLMWGIAQPFSGAFADRYGTRNVLLAGAMLIALGFALTPLAQTPLMFILVVGVLAPVGAGFAGPAVLMSAVNRSVPVERRGWASGLVNAGGSFGQFSIVPLAGALLTGMGWINAMYVLGALALVVIPLSKPLWLPGTGGAAAAGAPAAGATAPGTMKQTVRRALRDRSFLCLAAGFFVCGFHVAFIATHLPGVIAACGLPPAVGAWSLAVIGLFNIAGSFMIGAAISRWRSRSLLSLIYSARALIVIAFMLAPKTELTFVLFAAAIGVSYLSTVPPTATLVGKLYGPQYMATLFGLVMLSHQVGGFLGASLGGKLFEMTHSYDWMWYADIMLAVFAALIHLPIREAAVAPKVAAA